MQREAPKRRPKRGEFAPASVHPIVMRRVAEWVLPYVLLAQSRCPRVCLQLVVVWADGNDATALKATLRDSWHTRVITGGREFM